MWFPGIDKLLERQYIPSLEPKAHTSWTHTHHATPSCPLDWNLCGFAGSFPSGEYLLVAINDNSQFPKVEILTSLLANVVILNMIFARQGYSTIVKTDNGPPFQGQDFKDFATQSGFRHRWITSLWPQANGEAKRFVCTLKRYILAITVEGFNWKTQLPHFLRQYRATPHSTTKISLFEACTSRKMNIGLPITPKNPAPRPIDDCIERKEIMKWYADRNKKQSPHPSA